MRIALTITNIIAIALLILMCVDYITDGSISGIFEPYILHIDICEPDTIEVPDFTDERVHMREYM